MIHAGQLCPSSPDASRPPHCGHWFEDVGLGVEDDMEFPLAAWREIQNMSLGKSVPRGTARKGQVVRWYTSRFRVLYDTKIEKSRSGVGFEARLLLAYCKSETSETGATSAEDL